jgi:GH35 family endo-1,4-beta-xylanase
VLHIHDSENLNKNAGHFIVGQVPTSFESVLQSFTAVGVEVAITELDIRMNLPETSALLAQQKTDYQNVSVWKFDLKIYLPIVGCALSLLGYCCVQGRDWMRGCHHLGLY